MAYSSKSLVSNLIQSQIDVFFHNRVFEYITNRQIDQIELSNDCEIINGVNSCTSIDIDSIDNRYLLTCSNSGFINLFDLENFKEKNKRRQILPFSSLNSKCQNIYSIQWFPTDTGAFITSDHSGNVKIFNTNTFQCVLSYSCGCPIWNSKIKNSLIAIAQDDGKISICDLNNNVMTYIGSHSSTVTSVDWHPLNSNILTSASKDGTVKFWDIRKGADSHPLLTLDWLQDSYTQSITPKSTKNPPILFSRSSIHENHRAHEKEVMSIKYSYSGNYLITSGNDRKIRVWNSSDGSLLPLNIDFGVYSSLPYNFEVIETNYPKRTILIFPVSSSPLNKQQSKNSNNSDISVISIFRNHISQPKILKGHLSQISSIKFRNKLNHLISASRDGMVLMWDSSPLLKDESKLLNFESKINNTESKVQHTRISNVYNFVPELLKRYFQDLKQIQYYPTKSPDCPMEKQYTNDTNGIWSNVDNLFEDVKNDSIKYIPENHTFEPHQSTLFEKKKIKYKIKKVNKFNLFINLISIIKIQIYF